MAASCISPRCVKRVPTYGQYCDTCKSAKESNVKVVRIVPKPVEPTYDITGLSGSQYMNIIDALHYAETHKRNNFAPVAAEQFHSLRLDLAKVKQRDA